VDLTHYRELVLQVAAQANMDLPMENFLTLDWFRPILERIRQEGAVVILKWDGERGPSDKGPYTALISGKALPGEFIRTDAVSLEDALSYVIVEYARRCWRVSM
jgi:hypothetical protein